VDADTLLAQSLRAPQRFFLRDYADCRQQFMHLVDEFSNNVIEHRSWSLPIADEPGLYTDAVLLGKPQVGQTLVLISGTHGVEGYVGSAIQRFLLQYLQADAAVFASGWNILLLHALNPWGMKHARRCDQDGIDLNRNFIDFSALPATDDDYPDVLNAFLMDDVGARRQQLMQLNQQWGQKHFDRLLSGGQYEYDWAPFYGGRAPAFAQQVLEEMIETWQLAEKRLVVIDLHSGLGPWGHGELISDHPLSSRANEEAQRLFGHAVAITEAGESCSVSKAGLMDYRWHQLMQQRGCFLTLEFGTLGTQNLFDVLINDHRLQHHGSAAKAKDLQQQRRVMLDHFFPDDNLWQQSVLFRGWQVVSRVLESQA
jgi:predicted deacylase